MREEQIPTPQFMLHLGHILTLSWVVGGFTDNMYIISLVV